MDIINWDIYGKIGKVKLRIHARTSHFFQGDTFLYPATPRKPNEGTVYNTAPKLHSLKRY